MADHATTEQSLGLEGWAGSGCIREMETKIIEGEENGHAQHEGREGKIHQGEVRRVIETGSAALVGESHKNANR